MIRRKVMSKVWKKWMALFAALAMAAVMTGCSGSTGSGEQMDAGMQSAQEQKGGEASEARGDDGEESEPAEVIFRFANYGPVLTDLQLVEDAMNEILIPKINCKIRLEAIDGSNYDNQMNLDLSSGTRIDVAKTAGSYNTAIAQNQILDMTELLEEYGQEAKAEVGEKYMQGVMVNGKVYGLPNVNGRGAVMQFGARTDLLKKYDLSLDGFSQQPDWESQSANLRLMEEILQKVADNEPDLIPLVADQVGNVRLDEIIPRTNLGDDLGVVMGGDSMDVVNYYASKQFEECCYLLRDWYQKGFIMKDVATTTESSNSILSGGKGFSVLSNSEIGWDAQLKNNTSYDFTCVKLSLPLVGNVSGMTYSIPVTAADPVASMKVLNELYTNSEIETLLTFGVEDVHYVLTEEGKAAYPEGIDANTSSYHHSNFWAVPNQLIALEMEGTVADYNKTLKENNETADVAKVLGFVFDNSSVQTETAACTAVIDEYKNGLRSGSIDVDKNLPEFLKKLEDAGINTIIEEKQRQLDQWAADNHIQ